MLSRNEFKAAVLDHCRRLGYDYDKTLTFVKQGETDPWSLLTSIVDAAKGATKWVADKGWDLIALPLLFGGPYVAGRMAAVPTYAVLNKGKRLSIKELQGEELLRTLKARTEELKAKEKARKKQEQEKLNPRRSVSSFI